MCWRTDNNNQRATLQHSSGVMKMSTNNDALALERSFEDEQASVSFLADTSGRQPMSLAKSTGTLTNRLINELGADIVRGQFNTDQGIHTESSIAEKYTISRSVAREAVKALIGKGLLCSKQKVGIAPTPRQDWNMFDADVLRWLSSPRPSAQLMKDMAGLCLAICPDAVAMAARKRKPEDIYLLQKALSEIKLCARSDTDALSAETEFFIQLLSASGNCFFLQVGKLLLPMFFLNIANFKAFDRTQNEKKLVKKYVEIFDYIKAQDPINASLAVQRSFQKDMEALDHWIQNSARLTEVAVDPV
jgi:DNA-binding FadR family transcriptional regulator